MLKINVQPLAVINDTLVSFDIFAQKNNLICKYFNNVLSEIVGTNKKVLKSVKVQIMKDDSNVSGTV